MTHTHYPPKAECELRQDPVSGSWSLVFRKPENDFDPHRRHKTLVDFIRRPRRDFESAFCVFSQQFSGGKRQEKKARFGLRWGDDGQVEISYGNDSWHGNDWEVMVVQTDYAQVVASKDSPLLGEDTFTAEAGAGVHDLIIEDPTEAHEPLGVMGAKRTQLVLMAMLYRLNGAIKGFPALDESMAGKAIGKESFVRHMSFFHNHRREAGGSQEHSHSQCIGIPIIPTDISAELEYARRRMDKPPRQCVFCEVIESEQALRRRDSAQSRVLFETEHFMAVVPYAPRRPFEVWILPKKHHSSFSGIQTDPAEKSGDRTQLEDLSGLLNDVLCRLYVVLNDPGYNMIVHTEPVAPAEDPRKWAFYHWHIRIQPRGLVTRAGFEYSTGIATLAATPEEMAHQLRRWGNLHASRDDEASLEWHIDRAQKEADGDTSRQGAVRRLKNIVKILEPMAGQVVSFVNARALLDKLQKEKPHLLLSPHQQQLPEEHRQLLQPEEHAGAENGPHFRCCPATGRWVLYTTQARRKDVAKLKVERKNRKEAEENQRKNRVREKAAARAKRLGTDVMPSGGTDTSEAPSEKTAKSLIKGPVDCEGFAEPSGGSWVDQALDRRLSTPSSSESLATPVDWLSARPEEEDQAERALGDAATGLLKELRGKLDEILRNSIEKPGSESGLWHRQVRGLEKAIAELELLAASTKPLCRFCSPDWPKLNEEIDRIPSSGRPDKQPYAIKNFSPLLTDRSKVKKGWPGIGGTGPFRYIYGYGACEVVVIPQEENHPTPPEELALRSTITLVRRRVEQMPWLDPSDPSLLGSKCIRHITVFSNHGPEAGATTDHAVWQVVGTPIVPPVIEREVEHHRVYSQAFSGRCCSCDMLDAEIREHVRYERDRHEHKTNPSRLNRAQLVPEHRSRIVGWSGQPGISLEDAEFVALCPYASVAPLEVWIVPREHSALFVGKENTDATTNALAELLHRVLRGLKEAAFDPGYVLTIQQAPLDLKDPSKASAPYHWRIVIEPQKLNIPAGFENLTGIGSNIVLPEDAADCLADTASTPEDKPSKAVVGAAGSDRPKRKAAPQKKRQAVRPSSRKRKTNR
jgi:UDPglucose--hexose-1-phosphate uridylyltransferase